MNDFYSVLTQSIIDRGLRSARDREATYSQARTAMIRRLWSYDPPLAEDEIDARIGQFDLAVDQIESNVVEMFEQMPELDLEDESQTIEDPPAPPPIVDSYDQEADYAPAFSRGPAETDVYGDIDDADGYGHAEEPVRPPPPQYPKERSSLVDLLSTLDIRSMAVEAALNSDPDDDPAPPEEEPPPAVEIMEDEPVEETRALLPVPVNEPRDMASYAYSYEEEAVLVEPQPRRAAPRPRGPAPQHRSPPPAKTRKRPQPQRQPKRPPREQSQRRAAAAQPARRKGPIPGQQLGILIGVVGVLAIALIAVTAYILMPGKSGQPAVATTPTTPAVAASSPANGLPPLTNGTLHRFVLFDGSDPTIFDSDPSNPVRFDGQAARVATSAASAGARAVIGPGLAARLGGHTVNVIVVARTASENGAANLRFALQSGLAVSYWKTASLTSEFAPISLTWRVPTLRTDPKGDSIVIEPGIPGDGTGTEIRAIVVDVLD